MKKPIEPARPYEYKYKEETVRKYIYSYVESLREDGDDYDDDDDDDSELEEPVATKDPNDFDLEWLISLVPSGIKLSQIKMEFAYNASCMAYEDHYIKFYYEALIPARTDEYQAALKQWETEMAQYRLDLEKYENQCKLDKVKELEAELKKLKGEI